MTKKISLSPLVPLIHFVLQESLRQVHLLTDHFISRPWRNW